MRRLSKMWWDLSVSTEIFLLCYSRYEKIKFEIKWLSGSKLWAIICKHPRIGTQQLLGVNGNLTTVWWSPQWFRNSHRQDVKLLWFQKSGPNSPPLPETMPPPSWGAQGTREVGKKQKQNNCSTFLPPSSFSFFIKIILTGSKGSQFINHPWITRNNHGSSQLRSHLCKCRPGWLMRIFSQDINFKLWM